MAWIVREHPEFSKELDALDDEVTDKLFEVIRVLVQEGPNLGRPHVDTLAGSKHSNMKEIRFSLYGVWRFAFAFDPERQAVLLIGGNKQGVDQKKFYKDLIKIADRRYDDWVKAKVK
jgi:hypothetical protein